MSTALAAVIIASAALVVSIISAVFAWKSSKAATTQADIAAARRREEVEEREAAEAAARVAVLHLTFAPREANSQRQLRIENRGGHDATDVTVTMNGPGIPDRKQWQTLGTIPAGDRVHRPAPMTWDAPSEIPVMVRWVDGNGRHEETRSVAR